MMSSHSSDEALRVAVQQLADAIDEDLGAAAGNAVEAGGDQPLDHRPASGSG